MSYGFSQADISRGKNCEKIFEQWCVNQGFGFEKTSRSVDMKYHTDYYVFINNKTIAVDVKDFGFNYNYKAKGHDVRCFEWSCRENGTRIFLNKVMGNSLMHFDYFRREWQWNTNISWHSWSDSFKQDLNNIKGGYSVDYELVAFVNTDTNQVLFMDRENDNIRKVLKKLWEDNGADKENTFLKPKYADFLPYKICGNQNNTKAVFCMWVKREDIEPYMMSIDKMLAFITQPKQEEIF